MKLPTWIKWFMPEPIEIKTITDAEVNDIKYKWHRYAMDRLFGCSEKGVDMVILNANRLCNEELKSRGATKKQIEP